VVLGLFFVGIVSDASERAIKQLRLPLAYRGDRMGFDNAETS
jgi:hypothetical protein